MLGALVRWLLYSAWFTAALVAFLYLSIPEKKLKRYVQHHASKALKSKVKIDDLEVRGISGVTLKGVKVELPIPKAGPDGATPGGPADAPTPGSEGGKDDEDGSLAVTDLPGLVLADEIRVDVNTIGLLTGEKLKAQLNAEISGGSLSNVVLEAGSDGWVLDLGEMTGIDLGPMRIFRALMKSELDVNGRLSGEGRVVWGGGLDKSTGKLKFELTDTLVPYVGLKDPRSGFLMAEMFQVAVGDLELSLQLDKAENLPGLRRRNRANHTTMLIDKLFGRGEHVEIQLDGGQQHTITFVGPTTGDADVDIKLVVHFTDEFFAWKGDGVRGDGGEAKGVSHAALRSALQMQLRRAQTKVGKKTYYGFHCRGKLKNFKCPPRAPSRRIEPIKPKATPPADEKKASAGANKLDRPKPSASASANRPKPPKTTRRTPKPRTSRRTTRPAGKLSEPSRPNDEAKRRLSRARSRTRGGMGGDMLAPNEEPSDDEEEEAEELDEEAEEEAEEERGEEDDEEEEDEDGVPEDGEPLDEDEESDEEGDDEEEGDEYDEEE